jgi:hypothetical protein
MKAPKISHTVLLPKPERAHVRAALTGLKPGFAISSGLYSTHGASTVAKVTPKRLIAGPGNGSTTRPTMTPAKMAKKYQACGAKPAGTGMSAMISAAATGDRACQFSARRVFVVGPLGSCVSGVEGGAARL